MPDFDEEARKLFIKLGLPDPTKKNRNSQNKTIRDSIDGTLKNYNYSQPDVVFVHPKSGAKLFIGDESAAQEREILEENGIFHIVNCKGKEGQNYFEKDP